MTKHNIFDLQQIKGDTKGLNLAKRYKDYNSIRRDLRDAYHIIGNIILVQQQKDLPDLKNNTSLLRAQFLYAILAYSRWFKSTKDRTRLDKRQFFGDSTSAESIKHEELIALRDRYIAHAECDILGGDHIWVEWSAGSEIKITSDFCIQIFDSREELKLIHRCIEIVHNEIDGYILPSIELELKKRLAQCPPIGR